VLFPYQIKGKVEGDKFRPAVFFSLLIALIAIPGYFYYAFWYLPEKQEERKVTSKYYIPQYDLIGGSARETGTEYYQSFHDTETPGVIATPTVKVIMQGNLSKPGDRLQDYLNYYEDSYYMTIEPSQTAEVINTVEPTKITQATKIPVISLPKTVYITQVPLPTYTYYPTYTIEPTVTLTPEPTRTPIIVILDCISNYCLYLPAVNN
jgi:hypothetical protein